jgi:hypothetical protein
MCFVYVSAINMLELHIMLKYCLEQEHCHTIIYFAELETFLMHINFLQLQMGHECKTNICAAIRPIKTGDMDHELPLQQATFLSDKAVLLDSTLCHL